MGWKKCAPVRSDDGVSERIDALALGLVLHFRNTGSVLFLLELATHLGGFMCKELEVYDVVSWIS